MSSYERIFSVGDLIRVVAYGDTFTGVVSHLGCFIEKEGRIDYELLLREHPMYSDHTFGAILIPLSDITKYEVLDKYSVCKDTYQDNLLNVKKIKRLMGDFKMTETDLAIRAEKDRPSISKILTQKRQPSLETAIAIAKALQVSLDEIVNR